MLYAFDTETYLITGNRKAPKPVCATWYNGQGEAFITHPGDDQSYALWADPANIFVGQNIAYDILCLLAWHPHFTPLVIRALDESRVFDTQIREQLTYLETKGGTGYQIYISLAKLVAKYKNEDRSHLKAGDDIWRLKYGTLDGVPFNQWPKEALDYALGDAIDTFDVFMAQGGPAGILATEDLQVRASIALSAMSAWGHHTNQDCVTKHYEEISGQMRGLEEKINPYQITGNGSAENVKKWVQYGWQMKHLKQVTDYCAEVGLGFDQNAFMQCIAEVDFKSFMKKYQKQNYQDFPPVFFTQEAYNPKNHLDNIYRLLSDIPRTAKGSIKAGEDDIKGILEYVECLKDRTEYKHLEKQMSTYVRPYMGVNISHSRYNTIVSTGRTSCTKPNKQNIPEEMRDILGPRPGHKLGVWDYSGIEMGTLAQTILARQGRSVLADMINNDIDLHCHTGGKFANKSYEHMWANRKQSPEKEERQGAKAVNFGVPGGLGAKALCSYAETTFGVKFTLEEAKQKIGIYKKELWDVAQYLQDIGMEVGHGGKCVAYNNSGRKKADCFYTQAANFPFQSLAADGAKTALYNLWKEHMLAWTFNHVPLTMMPEQYGLEYVNSPLIYSNTVNFIHDEIVQEHLDSPFVNDAYERQNQIMLASMKQFVPDVKVKTEGHLGDTWEH